MDMELKENFISRWKKYSGDSGTELANNIENVMKETRKAELREVEL